MGLNIDNKIDTTGGCELIKNHVQQIICNNDPESEYWMNMFVGRILTAPQNKIGMIPAIIGGEGSGKGLFMNMVMSYFGTAGMKLVSFEKALSEFNSFHLDKCFLLFDEVKFIPNKAGNLGGKLRALVTEDFATVTPKGGESVSVRSYVNCAVISNHPDCLPPDGQGRRYAIFHTNDKYCGQEAKAKIESNEYFSRLKTEMVSGGREAYANYVMSLARANPRWNPSIVPSICRDNFWKLKEASLSEWERTYDELSITYIILS